MIASVIMAVPRHVKLLFDSSYSVTLLCIIGGIVSVMIAFPNYVYCCFTYIDMSSYSVTMLCTIGGIV